MPITAESKKRLPKKRKKSGSSWANLPEDILFVIFQKLGAVDILLSAQAVCRSWRRLALMPDTQVWRCIDMRYLLPAQTHLNLAMLTRVAVDRSSGNIDKLYARSLSDDDLYYISSRTAGLRCFGLISSKDVSPKVMVDFVSQCPLLQELHICACGFEKKIYRDVGQVRPELKRLLVDAVYKLEPDNRPKLDSNSDHEPDSNSISESDRDSDYESDYKSDYGSLSESDYESEPDSESDRDSDYKSDYKSDYGSLSESDYESESDSDVERRPVDKDGKALEIAENMQQLHELQLAGDWMTNMGLHAILAKCLHLEYLDIRGCFNLRIFDDEVLQAKLAKIKTVRL